MIRLLLISIILQGATASFAQYKIHFKINGLKNVTAYLGSYADDKTLTCDTAVMNHKGDLVFQGFEPLPEGLYFVSLDQTKLFDFVVGENQFFDMTTSTEDYVTKMRVVNDQDNIVFFESMVFNMELLKEAEPLLKIISNDTATENERRTAQMTLNKIKMLSTSHQDDVIENHPNTVTARLFKSARTIELSNVQDKTDTVTSSASQREWYASHFGLY
jgi:hypothetical protein